MSLLDRLAQKYEVEWLERTRRIADKSKEAQALYTAPQSVQEQLEVEGINWPYTIKFDSGQIDSSSTGDTVLLTGATNKMYLVTKITAVPSATPATFQGEMDTGSSFGTTRVILGSGTSALNDGGGFVLHSTERLVVNVTAAVAASTIDYTISYYDLGFGTVWSQS
tara:strand:+ start:223 stop:720 length:498 start_codon:yes stop_codon:yes gene_type:complete